ncbi:MAG: hypothetical protein NTU95_08430 [Methanothrix sp.]|nr:hypothetical protein [Methanothrix sp.]
MTTAVAVVDSCPFSNKNVAPDDTIVVSGPAPDATQTQLGITWKYKWITKDSAGTIVDQTQEIEGEPGRTYQFTVPKNNYAEWYSIELLVTAVQADTCINQACTKFRVMKPNDCSMETNKPTIICTEDDTGYTYSTGSTPAEVRQRWWIFPEALFPGADAVTWGGFGNYKVPGPDTNSITTSWYNKPTGKYIVFTGYYPKTGNDKTPLGSCQMVITIVAKPENTITEAF